MDGTCLQNFSEEECLDFLSVSYNFCVQKCFKDESLVNEIWNRISGTAGKSNEQWTNDDYTYTFDPSTLSSNDCQRLFQNVFDSFRTNFGSAEKLPEAVPEARSVWLIFFAFFLAILAAKIGTFLFERLFEASDPVKQEIITNLSILKDPIKNSLELLRRISGSSGDDSTKSPEASEKQQESPKIIPEAIGDFSTEPAASQMVQVGPEGELNELKDQEEFLNSQSYSNEPNDGINYLKKPENPATSENHRQSLLQAPKRYPSRFFHQPNVIPVMSILRKCSSELLVDSHDQKDSKNSKSSKNFLKINRDRIKSMEQDKDPLWKGRTRENTAHSMDSPVSTGSSKTSRSAKSAEPKFDLD